MKLNLGCGKDIREGYINIDFTNYNGVDVVHDLNAPLPYADNTIDEIVAQDILEHFTYVNTDRIFNYWVRVLKSAGVMILQVPDIDKHIDMYLNHKIERHTNKPVDIYRLRSLIFGGKGYVGNGHYTCFNKKTVIELFQKHNLEVIEYTDLEKGILVTGKKV